MRNHHFSSASLLAFISSAIAQLPYNPTRIITSSNGSITYIFSSQSSFSYFDTSGEVSSTPSLTVLNQKLPFQSGTGSKAFIPLADDDGITVLAGDCQNSARGLEIWRYNGARDGKWTSLQVVLDDESLSANYLSAGFTFSPTTILEDSSAYVFGGMCPDADSAGTTNWVSDAIYSNTMVTLSVDGQKDNAPYQLSMTGARAPPIAEAGLTITPLLPTSSNSSTGQVSQQQNFVLLGGHTQNAFINMSQVALFSLPQASWAFIGIDQPGQNTNTELMVRDTTIVEPRSGHTAVLTEDGSKIVVLGGWVGDTSTPAQPQVAVLEIGEGYGGAGSWEWTVPQVKDPIGEGTGIYGHGAALLPGGVMIVYGGNIIATKASKVKRQSSNFLFFNTTSLTWMDHYINPASPKSPAYVPNGNESSTGLSKSEKTGIGAGVGFGIIALSGIVIFWLIYSRRLRRRRAVRERELRELALGAERYHSPSLAGDDRGYPSVRTVSWTSQQERSVSRDNPYPWAPLAPRNMSGTYTDTEDDGGLRQAERTGVLMDLPSPTRGLRKNLHSRIPPGFGAHVQAPTRAPGAVFRIDEEEEGSQTGSIKRSKTPKSPEDRRSVVSDPFKDPPVLLAPRDDAAEKRKREVEGWVEDWQSAAESMSLSRNPSHAHSRTYSNLSQNYSHSHSGSRSDPSGRSSPEKSDRTGSNLSDRSVYSQLSMPQSREGVVSRNMSQRSASAGYALFSGAAAAMGRLAGTARLNPGAEQSVAAGVIRFPSNRSVSLNISSVRQASVTRERADTMNSIRPSISGAPPTEDQVLLSRNPDDFFTPPESPIKERHEKYTRAGSLTRSGVKALGLLGSVRRVFTGTGGVDVQDRVNAIENRSGQSSPTKHSGQPEMVETLPRRSLSAGHAFWRGKQGAKDWIESDLNASTSMSTTAGKRTSVRRKPVPGSQEARDEEALKQSAEDEDDWDIETAVQQRVVQVMFTVPKEKLRVVNADALSLLSSNRSEIDHEEDKDRSGEVKRMSSVKEGEETVEIDQVIDMVVMEKKVEDEKGKGKEKVDK